MELRADVPTMSRNLHNLDKTRAGIDAHALHALGLVFFFIPVVDS